MKSKRWKRRNRVKNSQLVRAMSEIRKGCLIGFRYNKYLIYNKDCDCLLIKTMGKRYLTTVVY